MKTALQFTLAAGLALTLGCSEQKEASTTTTTPEKPVVAAPKNITATTDPAKTLQTVVSNAQALVSADLNRSLEEIKTRAAAFSQSELLTYANSYKDTILEKKNQIASLAETLKKLPVAEMLGPKGKQLKETAELYTKQLIELKDRYNIYIDKLKPYGIDLSKYQI